MHRRVPTRLEDLGTRYGPYSILPEYWIEEAMAATFHFLSPFSHIPCSKPLNRITCRDLQRAKVMADEAGSPIPSP